MCFTTLKLYLADYNTQQELECMDHSTYVLLVTIYICIDIYIIIMCC
jgi:hypothetical protein